MNDKKIGSFTGLRFIMIMVIVLSHFEFLQNLGSFGTFYSKYLHNPTMAVDFFFLLSGFGMMLGSFSRVDVNEITFPSFSYCLKFGINHVKKIYPIYIATIIFGLCAKIAFAIYESSLTFSFLLKEAAKLLVNIPLLQSATGMMFFTHAYNAVAWFLSALFCIYIVAPVFIYALRKTSKSYCTDFLYLLLNLFFIIMTSKVFGKIEGRFHDVKGIPNVDYLVYGSPYIRVFYVLIGMNLAMIFKRIQTSSFFISSGVMNILEITICALALIYFLFRNSLPNGMYKYLVDVFLCSFFVFVFAFDEGRVSALLNKNAMQTFGRGAMYIYLIHYPIIIYFGMLVEKTLGWSGITSFCFIIFVLFSTFLISWIILKRRDKA